eukprot:TRINITY_DN17839_c0_g1_i1.p1 TRINITY_DN17839_c0_g1~~TRINITY_DN17839_c0_g1_i1.p1  ORF type:complete len:177 (-),score=26.23 TRINITY_DN17839_c0_g1_i1:25-555(-)
MALEVEVNTLPTFLDLKESKISGKGIFATRDISPGVRLLRYVGPYVKDEDQTKMDSYTKDRLLRTDSGRLLDGSVHWNMAKYFNHSCSPNCFMNNENWIVTLVHIGVGEELTWFYSEGYFGAARGPCKCNSIGCVWKTETITSKSKSKKDKSGKKSKKFHKILQVWKLRVKKDRKL